MIYTIMDIETSGYAVKDGVDDILTFGFMRINSNFEIKASGTLYFWKPGFRVEGTRAQEVHHLTNEIMMPHASEFNDNLKKMYSLCYQSTIIGKRSTLFDMPAVKGFIKKHCPSLADSTNELQYFKTFDLEDEFSPIFRERTGRTNKGTLTDYIDCLGITQDQIRAVYDSLPTKDGATMHMHGALYDVVATYMVFKELCDILKIKP